MEPLKNGWFIITSGKKWGQECWSTLPESLENESSQSGLMAGHFNTVILGSLAGGSESDQYKNYSILKISITWILLRGVKYVYCVLNVLYCALCFPVKLFTFCKNYFSSLEIFLRYIWLFRCPARNTGSTYFRGEVQKSWNLWKRTHRKYVLCWLLR